LNEKKSVVANTQCIHETLLNERQMFQIEINGSYKEDESETFHETPALLVTTAKYFL
jgi:hypothetical protein